MSDGIDDILDTIRPYLQADGGDVRLVGVSEEGVVRIQWLGRCAACPVSNVSMRSTVERILKQSISSVKRVVATTA